MPNSADARRVRLIACLIIGLGSLAFAIPAAAHDGLIVGAPGPGQDVGGEVEVIQLYFGEPILEATVTMEDPSGADVDGRLEQPTKDLLEFEIDALELDGPYIVRYSVLFEDEASFEAAYQFSYQEGLAAPLLIEVENRRTGTSLITLIAISVLAVAVVTLFGLFLWRHRQLRRLRG